MEDAKLIDIDVEEIQQESAETITQSLTKFGALEAVLLGNTEITDAVGGAIKEFKCVQDYLNLPLNDPKEAELKQLFAAGIVAANEQGTLPFDLPSTDPVAIASMVDEGLTRIKTAYQVGTGELEPEEVIDQIVDHQAARLMQAVDEHAEEILETGVDLACDAVITIAPEAMPAVEFVRPIAHYVVRRVTPKVKKFVKEGIQTVATSAKSFLRTAYDEAKTKARSIWNKVTNWLNS